MAPHNSSAETWKYVKNEGLYVTCLLYGHKFCGSLTRVVDHLLGISNGSGGGVEGCKGISNEQKVAAQQDYDKSKAKKGKKGSKKAKNSEGD